MVSYYGRKVTVEQGTGLTGAGNTSNERWSVFEPMPEHGWGHTIYLLAGRAGGTSPTGQLAIGAVDANGNPNDRMGWTNTITFSSPMSSGSDGSVFSAGLTTTDLAYAQIMTAVELYSGRRYALGFSAIGAQLYHGLLPAADPANNFSNTTLYRKDNGSVTPSEPMYTVATNEGNMTIAIGYDPNDNPATPTNRSPSGTVNTLTPTFNSDFNDANTNRGDYLKQYQIQVRQVGQTTLKWDTGSVTASSAERSAAVTTTTYGGSALTSGTAYEWRIRHRDHFDAWSSWSSWLSFTPSSGGFLGQGSSPVGKQLTQTPGPFVLPYTHGGGLSTNAVQIRLVSGSTVLQTSPIITKTVAPGANASITWAETGFTAIPWGTTLAYEARARDTTNVWSDYGPNRTISTDYYPNQPSIVSPKNGVVLTARPMLIGKVTDPDNAAPLSSVTCRIKNSSGSVLFTRTMALQAGSTDTYQYQTTATDLASFAAYQWDMSASDGTLTGPISANATFSYVSGPSVAITSPTAGQVLTTSTPTFAWTAATQVSARVDIFDQSTGAYIIGADINSATTSWAVPSGYLKNNGTYTFQVIVTDNVSLTGTASQNFSLVYTPGAAVANFTVSPLALANDSQPSVNQLNWTAVSAGGFNEYILKRRISGTAPNDVSEITLVRLNSISQVTFTDTTPTSGVSYTYQISYTVTSGTDIIESNPASADGSVTFQATILSSVSAGTSYRAVLHYGLTFKVDWRDERETFIPWGATAPTVQFSSANFQEARGGYRIVTDRRGNAPDTMDSLRALKARQISMADVICLRDGRGRKMFGVLSLSENDETLNRFAIDVGFMEVTYPEGV